MHLVWNCDHCDAEVFDGKGYLLAHRTVMDDYNEEQSSKADSGPRKPVTMEEILALRPKAPWLFAHSTCDPVPNDHDDYWIRVEECRTLSSLLDKVAHLLTKSDLASRSDISGLVRRIAQVCEEAGL